MYFLFLFFWLTIRLKTKWIILCNGVAFKNAEATICKTTFHLPIYSYKHNHSPIYSPAVTSEEKCHHNIIIATIIFHFSDYKISVACNARFFLADSVLHVLVNCTFFHNPIASICKTQNIWFKILKYQKVKNVNICQNSGILKTKMEKN